MKRRTFIKSTSLAGAAGTLTGATLNATVTASSLTSVGTLATLTVTAAIVGSVTGSAATLTTPRAINGVNFDGSVAIEAPDQPQPIAAATTSKVVSGYQRISVAPTFDGTMTLDGQWVLI